MAAVSVLLLLTSCGPYAPRSLPVGVDESSVVGAWVHDADDSSDGAVVEFHADGTLSYLGLPAEIVDPEMMEIGGDCNDVIAGSSDLRDGEGTWEMYDSRILVDFPAGFTWIYPTGFLSFDRIEFICDIDHAGSYVLDRAD